MREHIETESEWQLRQAIEIIEYEADSLYVEFPFMYRALHPTWTYFDNEIGQAISTDGERLILPSLHIIELFKKNEIFLRRSYLHTILHCLYGHLWLRGNRAKKLYDLSCDIAVEKAIDEMGKPSTKRILGWIRQSLYGVLDQKKYISPAQIYDYLMSQGFDYIEKLYQEFYVDDHSIWPKEDRQKSYSSQNADSSEKKWQLISHQTKLEKDRNEKSKNQAVERFLSQVKTGREKMNYKDFLTKFARPREEIHINEDELDMGYYSYGLRYLSEAEKKVPLIEPLESSEKKNIKAFVIAIDTSASTQGDLVKNFLRESVILLREAIFSRDCIIYLLQCDDKVQKVEQVSKATDVDAFFSNYEILGGGNTSFVPVFDYIEKEIEKGHMKKPEGLVYFTDGRGRYPKTPPEVKTAFVFLEEYDSTLIPPWAIAYKPNI